MSDIEYAEKYKHRDDGVMVTGFSLKNVLLSCSDCAVLRWGSERLIQQDQTLTGITITK